MFPQVLGVGEGVDKEYRDGSKVAGSLPPMPTGYRCGRMKRGGGCR